MVAKKKFDAKWIGILFAVLVLGGIAYLFFSSSVAGKEIPPYITGETRTIYEWAATPNGKMLLEQIPCYCGCKFEGHLHAWHCFWRDDGSFDKHGTTCSVCLDIGKKTKAMHEAGKSICEIRDAVDAFYAPNKALGTNTPYPSSCGA